MSGDLISQLERDIKEQRAIAVQATARLEKLEAALEVLKGYQPKAAFPHRVITQDADEPSGRLSIADMVEAILLTNDSMRSTDIFEAITAKGRETTQNTITTTLTRMRHDDKIENMDGSWSLTIKRRRALGR